MVVVCVRIAQNIKKGRNNFIMGQYKREKENEYEMKKRFPFTKMMYSVYG